MSDRCRCRRIRRASLAAVVALGLLGTGCGSRDGGADGSATTVTVASVGGPQMQDLEKLTPEFRKDHPDINVKFVILPENEVRDRVTQDIATQSGQYDAVTIGPYDVPIWAKNGWLTKLDDYANQGNYDANDLLPPIKRALTFEGALYGVPFYAESSFLMYRKDLFRQAGLTMPAQPTWDQVAGFAQKLNNPSKKMAGICLRGLPGWGEVLAPLNTVILTYGGRWYDENWNAHLTDPETKQAVKFYVDLVRRYGEPDAPNAGFPECMAAIERGDAAMWYDATVAGASLEDSKTSKVAGKMGYVAAPVMKTDSSGWLWAWSFAIPKASKNADAAWQFMSWATSKQYQTLVGRQLGWSRVPPGTRASTYDIPAYQRAAKAYAAPTLASLLAVNIRQPGLHPQPWAGVQYVTIPEFEVLGTRVSEEISAAIAGEQTVDQALAKAQNYAEDTARGAGYTK